MSLVLVKETGAGLANANSYADAADGDAYHEGHLYATAWTGALTATKEKALVMATRLIDAYMDFGGVRTNTAQALQWPQAGCPDPDQAGGPWQLLTATGGGCFDASTVPAVVVAATCEMARELLVANHTAAPMGEGLVSSRVGDNEMVFDRVGRAPVLSRVAIVLLSKVGSCLGDGSPVLKLERV